MIKCPDSQGENGNNEVCPSYLPGLNLVTLVVKSLPASAGDVRDPGSIPGSGRYPGEVNGNKFQYSYLENPMDRGTWLATAHGITKSWTQLRDYTFQTYNLRPLPSRPSFRNLLMNHIYPNGMSLTYLGFQ